MNTIYETSPRQTTLAGPQVSCTTVNRIAEEACDLRRRYDPANLGGKSFPFYPVSSPTPNPDQVAKAFAFLNDGIFASSKCQNSTAMPHAAAAKLRALLNQLDFRSNNELFICYEFSSHMPVKEWLGFTFAGLVASAEATCQQSKVECQLSLKAGQRQPAPKAPAWLVQRMETLRQMPPPTLEEVDIQLKASAEVRKKLTSRLPVLSSGPSNGKRF